MENMIEKIYMKNSHYVYKVALSILRDKEEAEDVMQNVFLKIMEKHFMFRGDCSIRTYLYRIAVNRAIDHIRFKARSALKFSLLPEPDTVVISENDRAPEIVVSSDLPEILKIPILLKFVHEYKYEEISRITKVSINTVKSRIRRGKIHLKRNLKNKKEFDLPLQAVS